MASNYPSECCAVGFKDEGTPTGDMIKIAGKHDAYVATPPSEAKHEAVGILYIPGALGIWHNSKLLADEFAANGFVTILLDIFNGDQLDSSVDPVNVELMDWIRNGRNGRGPHTPCEVDFIIADAIQYMRRDLGLERIGSVGYCFGAKYVIRHCGKAIDVGYIAHPSFVEEKELAAITGPLSIAAAEIDPMSPAERRHTSEQILQQIGQPYQINLFSGAIHGFADRIRPINTAQRFAKTQAFRQSIQWFNRWLVKKL
ncbi:Alpha/Beta hydrolase protein [Xylogone sp. PMI_703]|nr:Alpha/Beta hydrolase protein [Xylogone sp. PMI_703]